MTTLAVSADQLISEPATVAALGVDRFIVVGPSMDAEQDEARRAQKTFVGEVLPAIREVSHAP